MGFFKTDMSSRIVLRREKGFWVAPNGVSYERRTPLLFIRSMPKHRMNARERIT